MPMRPLFLFLVILLSSPSAPAQVVSFTNYTTREGLLSDIVNTIVQDSRGYLWAGTWEGISVFDGITFRNLTPADGLPSTYVNCLTELRSEPGTMAAGMNLDGICLIRDFRVTPMRVGPSAEANRVLSLMEDSRGVLWCGTAAGLFRIHHGEASHFKPETRLGQVGTLLEAPDSTVWFLSDSGLHHYDPGKDLLVRVQFPVPAGGAVHLLAPASGGRLWAASTDGSVVLIERGRVLRHFRIGVTPAFFLFDDRKGHLWTRAGTELLQFPADDVRDESAVRYRAENGIDGTYAASALLDREGSIWFGGKGITRLHGDRLVRFPSAVAPRNPYTSIAGDMSGRLWSLQGGDLVEMRRRDEHRWSMFRHRLTRPNPLVVTTGRDGLIWVGFQNGDLEAYRATGGAEGPSVLELRQALRGASYAHGGNLSAVTIDGRGRAWVGLTPKGIAVLDPDARPPIVRFFAAADSFPMYSVRVILEDRNGNIWAGEFGRGLAILRGGIEGGTGWAFATRDHGLPDNSIRSLAEGPDGSVWIGTRYGGLARFKDGKYSRVGFREGLRSNAIWGIASDSAGVWLATGAGVGLVPRGYRDSVVMIAEYPRTQVSSIVPLAGGRIATATNEEIGILRSFPDPPSSVPPTVHITRASVDGRPATGQKSDPYAHTENHWVFDFVGISLAAPSAVRYQYRLEGAESEWHPPTAQRTIAYSALAPGSYRFTVRAVSGDGVPSREPAVWSFRIDPPFWAAWWFRGLAGLAVAGAGIAVYSARVRQLKKDQEAQREFSRRLIAFQEKERERIGAELHDGLGQELLVVKNGLDRVAGSAADRPELAGALGQLSDMVHSTLREVRDISYDLHPHTLDRLGLRRALESVAARFAASSDIAITATVEEVDGVLSKEKEINLFRIAQECLNNLLRHSGARTARVTVRRIGDSVELVVEDDGQGFDPAAAGSGGGRGGFGLPGMRERARLLGGTMTVRTGVGAGTTITTRIPA